MGPHHYHINLNWDRDRKGTMCSPELMRENPENGCIEVATPPEFTKGIPGIWSPEHLFTGAVVSCFMTTFLAIAENSKLDFKNFSCEGTGKLEIADGKLRMTQVNLYPRLAINRKEDHEKAMRILNKSESACLISNSIITSVVMQPTVYAD